MSHVVDSSSNKKTFCRASFAPWFLFRRTRLCTSRLLLALFLSRASASARLLPPRAMESLLLLFLLLLLLRLRLPKTRSSLRARPRRPRRPPFVSSLATRAFFYRLSSTTQRVPRLAFSPLASSPRRASPRGWFSVSFPPL